MPAPAQASSPVVTLMKGQTQYIEMSLKPGQYLVHVIATGENAKASFSMYETNGRLIKKSFKLPPELQAPNSDQGAAFEISHEKVVHFWIHMDTCKTICGTGLVTVKVSPKTIDVIEPPFNILPDRPSYSSPESPQAATTQKPAQKQVQPEVIVENPRPSTCNFTKDEKLKAQCSRFKLAKIASNNEELANSLSINFGFDNVIVTYIVPPKVLKTVEHNGKMFKIYPVAARMLQQRGQKPKLFTSDEGTCVISSDYSEFACGKPEFLYTYSR